MNRKLTTTLLLLASFWAGCDKPPTASTNPAAPVQAEPFHGEVYRSFDGRTTLTLISRDECELREGGTTLLCKYTKQADALRVVATAMGTNQVLYYRFTDQGIQDNNGAVLLAPQRYAAAMEQARVQQERQDRMRRDAEQQRMAEENRKRAAFEEQKGKFVSWLRGYFAKGQQHKGEQTGSYHAGDKPYNFTLTLTDEPDVEVNGNKLEFKAFGKLHWLGKFENGEGAVGAPPVYYKDLNQVRIRGEASLANEPFTGSFSWFYVGSDGRENNFDSFTFSSMIQGCGFTQNGLTLQP